MDLNVMMREQARNGLNSQLQTAVTNGDTETALKITKQLEDLAVATAPPKTLVPYTDTEIRAELDKLAPWFGVDGRKTKTALDFGKDMNIKKFATAEEFAKALIKSVDEHFAPPATATKKEPPENETDEEREAREAEEAEATETAAAGGDKGGAGKTQRRTDGPSEGDTLNGRAARSTGPWTKLAQAPREIQAEINRSADKFVPANASKEQRAKFISDALASHYAIHQRNKGKK